MTAHSTQLLVAVGLSISQTHHPVGEKKNLNNKRSTFFIIPSQHTKKKSKNKTKQNKNTICKGEAGLSFPENMSSRNNLWPTFVFSHPTAALVNAPPRSCSHPHPHHPRSPSPSNNSRFTIRTHPSTHIYTTNPPWWLSMTCSPSSNHQSESRRLHPITPPPPNQPSSSEPASSSHHTRSSLLPQLVQHAKHYTLVIAMLVSTILVTTTTNTSPLMANAAPKVSEPPSGTLTAPTISNNNNNNNNTNNNNNNNKSPQSVFHSRAFGTEELTNSLVASEDTRISPAQAYAVLRRELDPANLQLQSPEQLREATMKQNISDARSMMILGNGDIVLMMPDINKKKMSAAVEMEDGEVAAAPSTSDGTGSSGGTQAGDMKTEETLPVLRALDLGCGAGVSTEYFFEMGYQQVVAVDWSRQAWDKYVEKTPPLDQFVFLDLDDVRFYNLMKDITTTKDKDKSDTNNTTANTPTPPNPPNPQTPSSFADPTNQPTPVSFSSDEPPRADSSSSPPTSSSSETADPVAIAPVLLGGRFHAISFNYAVNEDKALLFARQFLAPGGRLLAPVNNQKDYWLSQDYIVVEASTGYFGNTEYRIVKRFGFEQGWEVLFQPDVSAESCQGNWCADFNGFTRLQERLRNNNNNNNNNQDQSKEEDHHAGPGIDPNMGDGTNFFITPM